MHAYCLIIVEARSLGGQQQSFWDPEANLIYVLRFLNDCNHTYSSLVYGQEFGGEGNGTPLQYPLLENPMDGGARWAAVHGVAESDTTEQLHFHFSLSCIGEGNGNPLQCSCLENPRDGEAWWAAIYGVTQSWTRLKRLSSNSSMYFGKQNILLCFP